MGLLCPFPPSSPKARGLFFVIDRILTISEFRRNESYTWTDGKGLVPLLVCKARGMADRKVMVGSTPAAPLHGVDLLDNGRVVIAPKMLNALH